jgi:Gryzun, putative trafficking through Golgi
MPLCQTSIPFPPFSFSSTEIRVHRGKFMLFLTQISRNMSAQHARLYSTWLCWGCTRYVFLLDHPSELYIGEPFVLSYTITNPTSQFAELQAQIEVSDAFVFSGYKQTKFRVLPYSSQTFKYHCHPILAGHVRLPRLKVDISNNGEVPATADAIVYVKPRRQQQ